MEFVNALAVHLVCGKLAKPIEKRAYPRHKNAAFFLSYPLLVAVVLGINFAIFCLFTPNNLYQELGIRCGSPITDIQARKQDATIAIMSMEYLPMNQRIQLVKLSEERYDVLTHPARRLSYDTFGRTDTAYAWAFKSTEYLLSEIVGACSRYLIYLVIDIVIVEKSGSKQAFKMDIAVSIMLMLFEFDLIMHT